MKQQQRRSNSKALRPKRAKENHGRTTNVGNPNNTKRK